MRSFARFATQRGETRVVATTAIDWAKLAQAEPQRHYRLQTVIRFARFMAAEDPRHQIPSTGIFRGQRQRPIPYIFSETEIAQLLLAARQLGPSGSLRPHTYSTFFGLLAVTGMRVSEARALHLKDVTVDGLLIRQTKFHKSRLLPVHETTREALEQYLAHRRRVAGLDPHLFVTRRHGKLSRTVVTQTFGRVPLGCGSFPPPENRVEYPHFSTCMREFCHGISSLFLPVGAGRACVAVRHAPLGVAKRPRHCVSDDTGAPRPTAKAPS